MMGPPTQRSSVHEALRETACRRLHRGTTSSGRGLARLAQRAHAPPPRHHEDRAVLHPRIDLNDAVDLAERALARHLAVAPTTQQLTAARVSLLARALAYADRSVDIAISCALTRSGWL